MTVDVKTETVINRPVELVARYAGDPTNAPHWYANIDSVEWDTPPPAVVGSRMAFVARFLGRQLAHTYETVESSSVCPARGQPRWNRTRCSRRYWPRGGVSR